MERLLYLIAAFLCLGFFLRVHADSECNGEHEYIDSSDGSCKTCIKCPIGQQPKEYCGYGSKSEEYTCEVCPVNTFSSALDYGRCLTCKPCERWNSKVTRVCSTHRNSECGKCYTGYFRPMKSDGSRDEECHSCDDAAKDNPDCEADPGIWSNSITSMVLGGFVVLLLVFIIGILLYCRKRHSGSSIQEQCEKEKNSQGLADEAAVQGKHRLDEGELLLQTPEQQKCEDRETPIIPRTASIPETMETHCVKPTAPPVSYVSADLVHKELKLTAEAPHSISLHGNGRNEGSIEVNPTHANFTGGSLTYSNMPTMECNSGNSFMSYSNLPTQPYEETPNAAEANDGARNSANQNGNSNSVVDVPETAQVCSVRRRSSSASNRKRRHAAPTSSNESLLDNVDRDSKLVGRDRISPVAIDLERVEFFDTDSLGGDLTKPHVLAGEPTGVTQTGSDECSPATFVSPQDCRLTAISKTDPNIVRPRPATQPIIPNHSLLPPPDTRSSLPKLHHSCEPCHMNRSLTSSEAILSSHTSNMMKIEEIYEQACCRVKDVPLEKLDTNLADKITLKLTDRPEGAGEPYPTIKTWRHVANCFKIDQVTVDNSRSLSDILRYLRAHRRHTILDLLNAISHIQRYDVLSDMCNHILGKREEVQLESMIGLLVHS